MWLTMRANPIIKFRRLLSQRDRLRENLRAVTRQADVAPQPPVTPEAGRHRKSPVLTLSCQPGFPVLAKATLLFALRHCAVPGGMIPIGCGVRV